MHETEDRQLLYKCALLALAMEIAVLVVTGLKFSSTEPAAVAPPTAIETELITEPEAPKLRTQTVAKPNAPEETLSRKPNPHANPNTKSLSEPTSNHTEAGPALAPTHGAILLKSIYPVIPEYLKSEDIHAEVVIEFHVAASGEEQPKLLRSSGNEELDQIALDAARKWKFSPAENDHHAVDSQIRLRIHFEVH